MTRRSRSSLRLLLILLTGLLVALPAAADRGCAYEADRSATIDTAGASRVEIDARAGDLIVRPAMGTIVRAEGRACASKASILDDIQIVTERRDDTVVVRAEIPETSGWSRSPYLDLEIEVPADIPLEVTDTSGDAEIRDVALRRMDDNSGDLAIDGTLGDLDLQDGSGDLMVRNVSGNLQIRDGSGDLRVRDLDGDLRVEDGSGDIRIDDVDGTVTIDEDGSGGIEVRQVDGSVIIDDDGSGDILVVDVRGDLVVRDGGSGDVEYSRIGGHVDVPADD